jgi:excisionase family DNA binding protein
MNGYESIGRASFSPKEIAVRNSVHISTVNRWLASGQLKSVKIGRLRRITVEQEKDFLRSHIH